MKTVPQSPAAGWRWLAARLEEARELANLVESGPRNPNADEALARLLKDLLLLRAAEEKPDIDELKNLAQICLKFRAEGMDAPGETLGASGTDEFFKELKAILCSEEEAR